MNVQILLFVAVLLVYVQFENDKDLKKEISALI